MSGELVRRVGKGLKAVGFLIRHWFLLRQNRRFRDRHKGQRVFVLCNGPSVLKQDLLPLRNEIVMSVSNGYLHKDFERIRPKYHFVPKITYGKITEHDAVQWFEEMDSKLGQAELFLAAGEYGLVQRHELFRRRSVHYLCLGRPFLHFERGIIDICGLVPIISSVPIMCLIAAMYMGFKEIFLLGTDHDSLVTGQYRYSFEPTVLRGKDLFVGADGNTQCPFYVELKSYYFLFNQYRDLKRIAGANGIQIYNATAGGLLDEFPRVNLSDVLTGAPLRG